MMKTRQGVRIGRMWALAGCCLVLQLLCITASYTAHEPEPVLISGNETAVLAPAAAEQPAGQQQPQPQPASNSSGQVPADASPSPSPSPRMATIIPLLPMVLPGCPSDDLLNSNKPWHFPRNWDDMTLEQQALHPINLLLMNMAGVASTDLMALVTPCLYSWGVVRGSLTKIVKDYKVGNSMTMKTIVLVFRTKKDVWVVFRPTDDDWAADFDCMYTSDLRKKLKVPTPPLGAKKLQLHRGFWAAYSAVDKQLMQEINKQLRQLKGPNIFAKPQVWLAGHSLGGALATIAAFRMEHDPSFGGQIGGVVTFGSPRVGNEVWQQLYQEKLMDKTLRWNNHRDLFAALPAKGQFCLSNSPLKTVFSFRHVGRAVLLCPSESQPGLQEFRFFPQGTETACNTGETLIIGTHLLGHYFDGWRRAYAQLKGFPAATLLSGGPHVRSVMCSQCALAVKQYPLPDNKAARNDGVVSCVNDESCNNKELFSVISWAGLFPTSFFRTDAVCDSATALCQVPSPALTQVQDRLLEIAPNFTAAVGALASKALQNSPLGQFFQGMQASIPGFNITKFWEAYNWNGLGNFTSGLGGQGAEGEQQQGDADGDGSEGQQEEEEEDAPDSSSDEGQAADPGVEHVLDDDAGAADGQAGAGGAGGQGLQGGGPVVTAALAGNNSSQPGSSSSSNSTALSGSSSDSKVATAAAGHMARGSRAAAVAAKHAAAPSSSSSSSGRGDQGTHRPRVFGVARGFVTGLFGHLQQRRQH